MKSNANNSRWYVVIGIAMVVVVILVKIFASNDPGSTTGEGSIPGIASDDWVEGSRTAGVVLTEYSDFQCPACASYYPVVKQLHEQFGDKLAIVYRHFPLVGVHPNAFVGAQAAEAAGQQNAFWGMHDILFENQNEWSLDPTPYTKFLGYARALNLNIDQFEKDYKSAEVKDRITNQAKIGADSGINSTPTFFVNGEKIPNPRSLDEFATLIDAAIKKSPLTVGANGAVHMHADFMAYVNGKALDFSLEKYQSPEPGTASASTTVEHNEDVHLHDKNGSIIHVHKQGVTLGKFFSSIGFTLTDDCLVTDVGQRFCADSTHSLKLFVNGARREAPGSYILGDLDQILVSYGSLTDNDLAKQIASVKDEACIYSKKCPERGAPPAETCVGGLGTDCTL